MTPRKGDSRCKPSLPLSGSGLRWFVTLSRNVGYWTASRDSSGCGQISISGTRLSAKAHRFSFEIEHGAIPIGLELDHLCRVRHCVNPNHLEAVTRRTNVLRGNGPKVAGLFQRLKTHCPAGHPYDLFNTRFYRGMRRCKTCHREQERARYGTKVPSRLFIVRQ